MPSDAIGVLIVDDFPIVRAGLRQLIDGAGDMRVVAEATNGREGVRQFSDHRPDVVLMDLRMPVMNGLEATQQICSETCGECRIVVLTGSSGYEAVYSAIDAGAKAYLLKTSPEAEILRAVRTVAAGKRYLPPSIKHCLTKRLACNSLTARELEILELIIHGFSNAEIATHLRLAEGTVKGHINRILAKMHVADRTQAAIAAISRGIFLWTEEERPQKFGRV